ncbi:MAG: 50S ribosomal protein L4 [Chthoniobacterales bacterium]|nr:50S ribosomal protein L4 [Chthoniobacterales bacterium]
MSAKVLTAEDAKKANIAIIDNGKGTQAVHDVVVALRANRRSGSANTKTKAEVNLSGAKPWRQKGTGRARAGYKSSPIWRGGGVVFGPKPRDYSKKTPKSVRRLALRKALSARILAGDVFLVDAPSVPDGKTAKFLAYVETNAKDARKVLVVSPSFDETTCRAARNLGHVQLVAAADVNAEHLLAFDKILLTGDALAKISERTAA